MAPADDTKLASAYHEAGIAVVARNLGLRVAWTTIQGTSGPAGHTELDDWWEEAEPIDDIGSYRRKLSLVGQAGDESVVFFSQSGLTDPRGRSAAPPAQDPTSPSRIATWMKESTQVAHRA